MDRVAEMEQTLIAGDATTKNSALASAKRLAEKRLTAEQLVNGKEDEVVSMGLVSEVSQVALSVLTRSLEKP
jgi:hypothetical protein